MTHHHCPDCGDEVEDADYAVRWPWAGSCRCMRTAPAAKVSYTGCDCHDSVNEAWVRDHQGVESVKAIEYQPKTVLDYRQLEDGKWQLKEEPSGNGTKGAGGRR